MAVAAASIRGWLWIPTIKNKVAVTYFKVLDHLDFCLNSFTGEIGLQQDVLDSLKSLNLSSNSFTGAVPINLGQMNALQELQLSFNQIH
ncbi:hypothetical protein MIMGU_mgv1a020514mg, partial [Erythranthe guttata]